MKIIDHETDRASVGGSAVGGGRDPISLDLPDCRFLDITTATAPTTAAPSNTPIIIANSVVSQKPSQHSSSVQVSVLHVVSSDDFI